MKIVTIVGARPQFVKAAAFSRALKKFGGLEEVIVHTGQHFDSNMSDIFFEEMEIPRPAYNLNIHSLSHGAMTGQMLAAIEDVLLKEKPSHVLVYGDTNSTLAGALAAKKIHVGVIHVEAGLRSFNMAMPEEVNRILTDRISDILICPTDIARQNLSNEGFDRFNCRIDVSGDVMYDAALYYKAKAADHAGITKQLKLENGGFVLCTLHRAENTDDPTRLEQIIRALNKINTEIPVLMPVHPRTKKIIESSALKPEFKLIDPVGYFDMIRLLESCSMVMTDSGGLQKEAYFFGKFCITLRDQTEWLELINHDVNVLAGSDEHKIVSAYHNFLNKPFPGEQNLYGDGNASKRICEFITQQN